MATKEFKEERPKRVTFWAKFALGHVSEGGPSDLPVSPNWMRHSQAQENALSLFSLELGPNLSINFESELFPLVFLPGDSLRARF